MREILFRGKAKAIAGCPYNNGKSDGEWVFGYIFRDLGAMKIRQFEPDRPECNDYEVDPETVGQYTGLTDKNGKRIFEGDICRFKRFNDVHVGEIVFNVTTASFIMWYQSIVGAYGEKATHQMLLSVCDDIEVIGNIYDNPELLGGETNGINR